MTSLLAHIMGKPLLLANFVLMLYAALLMDGRCIGTSYTRYNLSEHLTRGGIGVRQPKQSWGRFFMVYTCHKKQRGITKAQDRDGAKL